MRSRTCKIESGKIGKKVAAGSSLNTRESENHTGKLSIKIRRQNLFYVRVFLPGFTSLDIGTGIVVQWTKPPLELLASRMSES